MTNAIEVRGIGKRYRLGAGVQSYGRLSESMLKGLSRIRRRGERKAAETIWALRDVTFSIETGRVVGIIGRNGAGKTTLLKVLSRITEPTEGEALIHGRVGALLEVGTGFHPELSGRDNVYLNGAILGMTKAEIRRRFDEIVAFAELDRFIDTPVKRYSSGMYVRLAFSVAAHLEPEILVVDEVLAVGDAAFQRKCLGRMQGVADEGRTVLFVSHNLSTVLALCDTAHLLDGGRLLSSGPARQVVDRYLKSLEVTDETDLRERKERNGDGSVTITSLRIESMDFDGVIRCKSRLRVTLDFVSDTVLQHPQVVVGVYDVTNVGLFVLDSDLVGGLAETLPPKSRIVCETGPINLTPGRCFLNVAILKGGVLSDHLEQAVFLDVLPDDVYGSGKVPSRERAVALIDQEWSEFS